jgi:hypothetical protein
LTALKRFARSQLAQTKTHATLNFHLLKRIIMEYFSLANLQHSLFIAVGLCLFMLAGHILVNNHEAKEISAINAARKAEIDVLHAENHRIPSSGKGKQGTKSAPFRYVQVVLKDKMTVLSVIKVV